MDYIIYHQVKPGTDCPDGIMAATVTAMYLRSQGRDYELIGDSYRHVDDYGAVPEADKYPFQKDDRLFIVDFSYPAHWLKFWESEGVEVTVIDHHAPKFPILEGFSNAVLDANECGATLAWKHFFPDQPLPELLKHVRRRDIGADGYYEGETPESETINEGLSKWRSERWSKADTHRYLQSFLADERGWILADEETKKLMTWLYELGLPEIEKRDRIVAEACARAEMRELQGYVVPFVQTLAHEDRYGSQIGNKLCKLHPAPFAWILSSDGVNNSLRSSSASGFDVSKVAESLGGGGHRAAAGFRAAVNKQ